MAIIVIYILTCIHLHTATTYTHSPNTPTNIHHAYICTLTYADTHYTQKLYIDMPKYSHTYTHIPITSIHTHRHTHNNMHISTHRPKSVVLPLEPDSPWDVPNYR